MREVIHRLHDRVHNLPSHWVLEIFLTIILSIAPIHSVLLFYISMGSVSLVFYWAHHHCKESCDLGCCEVRKQWLYSVATTCFSTVSTDKATYQLGNTVSNVTCLLFNKLPVTIPMADKDFYEVALYSLMQRVTRLHGLGFAMPMCKEAHCCWYTGDNDSYRSPRITNIPYILLFYLTNTIASLVPYYAHAAWEEPGYEATPLPSRLQLF